MDYSWLRFSTAVTLQSERSVEECVRSLQSLTAPPNSYSREKRRMPFRGKISINGGWLRFPFFSFNAHAARRLRFRLLPSGSGTVLEGEWKLLKRFRIPVGLYLSLCCVGEGYGLISIAMHRAKSSFADLIGPAIGFAMIYGWIWIVVRLTRRADAQLTAAVKYAMKSDELTKIVDELQGSMDL